MTGNVVSVNFRGDKFDEPWLVMMCVDTEPEKFVRYHLIAEGEPSSTAKKVYDAAAVFEARYGKGDIWKILTEYAGLLERTTP